MEAEITKILPFTKSRNSGTYMRIEFKLEGGSWAKTDIVIGFRNYRRWKRVARVGNIVKGLKIKDLITIDADSPVQIVNGKLVGAGQKYTMQELSRLGVFG